MNTCEIGTELLHLLDGQDLAMKQHDALLLLTVNEEGWPHTAMISVGEIVALNATTLRIGVWPGTETSRNMVRTGQATLVAIVQDLAYYTRLTLQNLASLEPTENLRQRFEARVVWTREDKAPYADIVSGISFELHNPVEVLARWERTVQDLLK
ncbi:hypothetical protein J2Z69_002592 [Paenibacillus shirakamiensis]|uniref:Pyridoxamine 5'-phosphate oxidase putative domain-containing protein n=1 Tax=Paenibacillus shirakamiensis TaxID=1265935 RepID=A0ABS4JIL9_9BACL|nr:pyridoxamine 5'-phosphate oxidase family protein [Paenibacillus shirakamiensis]MBP2001547.1 hypothetical protein [Paenibacillus shirakamiensis]